MRHNSRCVQVLGVANDQDERGAYALTEESLHAQPRDVNSIPGHAGDVRTLDKLIDGVVRTPHPRPLCELCTQMYFTGGGVSCCIVLPGQPVR